MTTPQHWTAERQGRDREDKDEYKLKLNVAFTSSKEVQFIEHKLNSSWLVHV